MKLIRDLGARYATKTSKQKRGFGLYECPVCKKHFETTTKNVKNGRSTKCRSCATKIIKTKHGQCKTRLYTIWSNMEQRCNNPKTTNFNIWGGRGISVCLEWREFVPFRDWALANGYKFHLSIDRINNDGNYEPSNCRWVTYSVQVRNTKKLRTNNTSGFKGVYFHNGNNKWIAQITINGKHTHIGSFSHPWTAAYVYDSFIIKNNLEHTQNFTK